MKQTEELLSAAPAYDYPLDSLSSQLRYVRLVDSWFGCLL